MIKEWNATDYLILMVTQISCLFINKLTDGSYFLLVNMAQQFCGSCLFHVFFHHDETEFSKCTFFGAPISQKSSCQESIYFGTKIENILHSLYKRILLIVIMLR